MLLAAPLLAGPTAVAFASGGYFDRSRLVAALAAWILVAAVAWAAPEPLPRGRAARIALGALLALGLLQLASSSWAALRGPAYDDAQRTALYLAVAVAAAAVLRDPRAARIASPVLLAGTVAAAGYGLSERLLPGLVDLDASRSALGRLEQPLTYWNGMGALAALGLVLAAGLLVDPGRSGGARGALACAAAVPLGAALVLTFSRGAIGAVAAGLVVLAVLVPARRAVLAVALLGLAAGAGAAVPPGPRALAGALADRQAEGALALAWLAGLALVGAGWWLRAGAREAAGTARPVRGGRLAAAAGAAAVVLAVAGLLQGDPAGNPPDGATPARLAATSTHRLAYWEVAGRVWAEHPLRGAGAGGFADEWRRAPALDERVRDAHSLPVEVAAELGLLGLALLLAAAGGVAVSARRAMAGDRRLYAGPAVALAARGAHASLDWDWELPGLTLVAAVLAGLLLAGAEPGGPAPPRRRATAARAGLGLLAVAILLPLAAAYRARTLAERAGELRERAGEAMSEPQFREIRGLLRRAQRWNPDPDPEVVEAQILLDRERPYDAVAPLRAAVAAEPRNAAAWALLGVAARREDPPLAALARRRARELAGRGGS